MMRNKAAQWKTDRIKAKIVFRLQFQASQVPQPGWEKLFVTLVSVDSGKPIGKTQKVSAHDGVCKWSDAIYESTRLILDPNIRKFDEKPYLLSVSTGSSRNGVLGETIINLADYADSQKPCSVSLPLLKCSFGTILHVTVEPLTGKTGFREFQQQRELSTKSPNVTKVADDESNGLVSPSDQMADILDSHDKSSDNPAVSLDSKLLGNGTNGHHNKGASVGVTKIPSLQDKRRGMPNQRDSDRRNHGALHSKLIPKHTGKPDVPKILKSPQSNKITEQVVDCPTQIERSSGEWTHGWSSDHSIDNSLVNLHEENEKLKADLAALQDELAILRRQTEKQVTESKRLSINEEKENRKYGCTRDVSDLKMQQVFDVEQNVRDVDTSNQSIEVTDSMKQLAKSTDIKLEKTQKAYAELLMSIQRSSSEKTTLDSQLIFEENNEVLNVEVKGSNEEELDWLSQLSLLENNIRDIQNKLSQKNERCLDSLPSDLQSLGMVVQNLRKVDTNMFKSPADANAKVNKNNTEVATENMYNCSGYQGFINDDPLGSVSEKLSSVDTIQSSSKLCENSKNLSGKLLYLEEQNRQLLEKLLKYERNQSGFNGKISSNSSVPREQTESDREESLKKDGYSESTSNQQIKHDYEPLIQDLKEQVSSLQVSRDRLRDELQNLTDEHNTALCTISTLENEVGDLKMQLNEQAKDFSLFRDDKDKSKIELEQRANKAEEALKKARSYNVAIVENLQKDLDRLSVQVTSSFETNEILATQAMADVANLQEQNNGLERQLAVAQESLQNSILATLSMRRQHGETVQKLLSQLDATKKNEEDSLLKLQSTSEELEREVSNCRECFSRNDELSQKLFVVESEKQNVIQEKKCLLEMVEDFGNVMSELENSRLAVDEYKAVRTGMESALRKVTEERDCLQTEYNSLKEELMKSENEVAVLHSSRKELESEINMLKRKLNEKISEILMYGEQNKEFVDLQKQQSKLQQILLEQESKLEEMQRLLETHKELQQKAENQAHALQVHNGSLEEDSRCLQESLQSVITEIEFYRSSSDVKEQELIKQLHQSKTELEEMIFISENTRNLNEELMRMEESYIAKIQELSCKNLVLETELEGLCEEKQSLIESMHKFSSLRDELESIKTDWNSLKVENAHLQASRLKLDQEKSLLQNELSLLRLAKEESSRELHGVKAATDELQSSIVSLKTQVDEKNAQLFIYEEKELELLQIKKQLQELQERFSEENDKIKLLHTDLEASQHLLKQAEIEVSVYQSRVESLERQLIADQQSLEDANKEVTLLRMTMDAKQRELDLLNQEKSDLHTELQCVTDELEIVKRNEENYQSLYEDMSIKLSRLETEAGMVFEEKEDLQQKLSDFEQLEDNLELLSVQKSDLESSLNKAIIGIERLENEKVALKEALESSDLSLKDLIKYKYELEATIEVLKNDLLQSETTLQQSKKEKMELQLVMKELEQILSTHQSTEEAGVLETDDSNKCSDISVKVQAMISELDIQKKNNEKYLSANYELSIRASKLETEITDLLAEKNNLDYKLKEIDSAKSDLFTLERKLEQCNTQMLELESSLKASENEKEELMIENRSVKEMLEISHSELEELTHYKHEIEVRVGYLQSELDKKGKEFLQLYSQHSELKQMFLEEEGKVEELRNHSMHLKRLQQKSEAEAHSHRLQTKEAEMAQESLRIALLREQYEAKEQQLTKQLDHTSKESEELLLKLQDTLKELDIQKRNRAQLAKKSDDLESKISFLESELQSLTNEKNNLLHKLKESESEKLELEELRGNLEFSKIGKAQLEDLLWKGDVEKEQLENEINSLKEMMRYSDKELDDLKLLNENFEMQVASLQANLENQKSQMALLNDQHSEIIKLEEQNKHLNDALLEQDLAITQLKKDKQVLESELQKRMDEFVALEIELKDKIYEISELSHSAFEQDQGYSKLNVKMIQFEEKLKAKSVSADATEDVSNGCSKLESLGSFMDAIQKELEKMKNVNLAPFQQKDEQDDKLNLEDPLENEVHQFNMVNEQLENMFPSFKEAAKGGNAVERVIALERELADALRDNTSQRKQFQSSFVKQLADQAAVLQSFRDINELINDMFDIKKRNSLLEEELKELQHRYSQMSLKFAEGEEERQKLLMSMKSSKTGKKS